MAELRFHSRKAAFTRATKHFPRTDPEQPSFRPVDDETRSPRIRVHLKTFVMKTNPATDTQPKPPHPTQQMKLSTVAACFLALFLTSALRADDPARFDLTGPKIDVRVTRGSVTLPIAQVPNLQPGDKLWIKADLPASQSNHLLVIVAFLRGTTNEPPDDWFTEIDTWEKKTAEGTTIIVPNEAQQAVMFVAPESGGDFRTLRSAVKGKPGLFIRADVDLNEASFEQQRIQRYLAGMKEVASADAKTIADHSAKLAATLALKPNPDCFKQPVEQQVNCLTISSAPVLMDDGHGQTVAEALSSGPASDFVNAASYTQPVGGGLYSAYVGAIVDLVHLVSVLRTPTFQYIPGLAFPQDATLNLKLNAPPSFHTPKSVIVIGLPAIQKAVPPPLKPHNPDQVACLLQPKLTLPIEGAPLVFSTSFAHDLTLHLNRTGAPTDLPLKPDAFEGGLIVSKDEPHKPISDALNKPANDPNVKVGSPSDTTITGTIHGLWGFDAFDGPSLTLQQVDGKTWKIVGDTQLFAGKDNHLTLQGDATACVQHIALTSTKEKDIEVAFKPATEGTPEATPADAPKPADAKPDDKGKKDDKAAPPPPPAAPPAKLIKNTLALDVSLKTVQPGGYGLGIKQYGDANEDKVPLTAYSADIKFDKVEIHAGDKTAILTGQGVADVTEVEIADKTFKPSPDGNDDKTIHLQSDAGVSPKDGSDATIKLKDGRTMKVKIAAAAARPGLNLLSFKATPASQSASLPITLGAKDDIPLNGQLTFVIQTKDVFPRTQTIEVATADETVKTKLSLATNTLILQDEHTAVATLDPLKAFGQSAFGKLQMRPVAADGTSGDWTPLGTLVRTPQISAITCTTLDAPTCKADGANLFLVQSFAAAKDAKPAEVPTGFNDPSIAVPTPADGATLYLTLRDDPTTPATVTLPTPIQKPAPAAAAQDVQPTATPPATPAQPPAPTPTPTPATAPPATAPPATAQPVPPAPESTKPPPR